MQLLARPELQRDVVEGELAKFARGVSGVPFFIGAAGRESMVCVWSLVLTGPVGGRYSADGRGAARAAQRRAALGGLRRGV